MDDGRDVKEGDTDSSSGSSSKQGRRNLPGLCYADHAMVAIPILIQELRNLGGFS